MEGVSKVAEGNQRTAEYIYAEITLLMKVAKGLETQYKDYDPHRFFTRLVLKDLIYLEGDIDFVGQSPSGEPWRFEISHFAYIKALLFWREFLLGGLGREFIIDLPQIQ
ncbi:MAG: hypothetical protein KatS3mg070_2085 [Meiothermus sp.]|nr:MAG: hypothetical protein KatS3mg070_2085 [Meiothermus sp.]